MHHLTDAEDGSKRNGSDTGKKRGRARTRRAPRDPDWGRGRLLHKNMLPFEVARVFVRKLGLRGKEEWQEWCKAPGHRPANIPSNPHTVYRDAGWTSTPPSSSSRAGKLTPRIKKEKKTKKPANAPSRKRARTPDTDRDLDGSSSGPDLTQVKGASIVRCFPVPLY